MGLKLVIEDHSLKMIKEHFLLKLYLFVAYYNSLSIRSVFFSVGGFIGNYGKSIGLSAQVYLPCDAGKESTVAICFIRNHLVTFFFESLLQAGLSTAAPCHRVVSEGYQFDN